MVAEAIFVTGSYDSYCTVADVLRLLSGYDLSSFGGTDDLEQHIRDQLGGAKAAVDAEAGRDFEFHADDEIACDGSGSDRLCLSAIGVSPVCAVHSVTVSDSEVASGEYALYGREGVLRLRPGSSLGGVFPVGVRNVTVGLDWGYEAAPGDIALAQARLVGAQILAELAGDRGSVESVHLGDYSVRYSAGGEHAAVIERWLDDARRTARSYRVVRVTAV